MVHGEQGDGNKDDSDNGNDNATMTDSILARCNNETGGAVIELDTTNDAAGTTVAMSSIVLDLDVSDQGCDKRQVGRWSHMSITGKNNLNTTIITGYTSCSNSQYAGGSAYSQQEVYMASHPDKFPADMTCPQELFGYDQKKLVESKQVPGHQIILQGDFNAEYELLEEWMLDLDLVDLINKKNGCKGPRTCTKSKDSPIDAIFGTCENQSCRIGNTDMGLNRTREQF